MVLFVSWLSAGWVYFSLCQMSGFSEEPYFNVFCENERWRKQNCWKRCAKWHLNILIYYFYMYIYIIL